MQLFLTRHHSRFYNPSATSLKPFLIPKAIYANGATWTTIGWQSGVILGPMLGGFMLAFLGRETSLIAVSILLALCFMLINLLQKRNFPVMEEHRVLDSLGEGFALSGKPKLYCGPFLWTLFQSCSVVSSHCCPFCRRYFEGRTRGPRLLARCSFNWRPSYHDSFNQIPSHSACLAQHVTGSCWFWYIYPAVCLFRSCVAFTFRSCHDWSL